VSRADTSRTAVYRPFAGRERKFQLRIGEIGELERLAGAGIGEIMVRLGSHRFKAADIRETIRLGLEGGGASEPEATALVMRSVDKNPLAEHLQLAADILSAAVTGIPDSAGKDQAAGSDAPETSPPSMPPAPPSASAPATSTA
jgi:hypothetical protein